jgi:hypothetical protein
VGIEKLLLTTRLHAKSDDSECRHDRLASC